MNETSFIKLSQAEVEKLCQAQFRAICAVREMRWRKHIDHLNEARSKRWFGAREPLSDEQAKRHLAMKYIVPDSYRWQEEKRILQLIQAARHPTLDCMMYVSCSDLDILQGGTFS